MKTILAVGELGSRENVYMASQAALHGGLKNLFYSNDEKRKNEMEGSDWIKTSTGKESVNANLPDSYVMLRAIRDYYHHTGIMVPTPSFTPIKLLLALHFYLAINLAHQFL